MSENKKNNEIIMPVSNVNNTATGNKIGGLNLIAFQVLLVMASISNYYVYYKLQDREQEFWDFVEQFNQFCKKNAWSLMTESFYFFMFCVGVSLVKKSIEFSRAKQIKKAHLSTPAQITQSLQKVTQVVEEKLPEVFKDKEIDKILDTLSFLTISCDYKRKTLQIGFNAGEKEFFVMSELLGIKSGYRISISIEEFFANILRDVEEKNIPIICEMIDSSLCVKFSDNIKLKQFVDIVFNVVSVIVEAELTLLECKEAVRGFNKKECDQRLDKVKKDFEFYPMQAINHEYYKKNKGVINNHINNIRWVEGSMQELEDKRIEIGKILLKIPSNNKEIMLAYNYYSSVCKVEQVLNKLATQYQVIETGQKRWLKKNVSQNNENNITTIGNLMVEQFAPMQKSMI